MLMYLIKIRFPLLIIVRELRKLLDISRNIKNLKTSYISHLVLFMVNSKQTVINETIYDPQVFMEA